jgi:hypothetical protein
MGVDIQTVLEIACQSKNFAQCVAGVMTVVRAKTMRV